MVLRYKIKLPVLFLIIFIITLALYYPSLNAYFVNDDYNWIKPVSFANVISAFWGGWGLNSLFRPVTRLLLYFEFLAFDSSPLGFHLVSILLQSSSVFLLLIIVKNFLRENDISLFLLLSLAAFYPHHEVVCWISTQTVLLSANFIFLSVISFMSYYKNGYKKKYYIASVSFYLLGLLSYEMSVVCPLICFMTVFLMEKPAENIKRLLLSLVPFVLLTAAYFLYRNVVLTGQDNGIDVTHDLSGVYYNFTLMLKFQFLKNAFLFVLTIISVLYLFIFKKEKKYLLFSAIWFFVCYSPYFLVNGYTGRFAYLNMFGALVFIGVSLAGFYAEFKKIRILIIALFVSYLAVNAVIIHKNAVYWFEAGEISRTIPLQLKEMHNSFPEGATLIFYDIPLGYQQAGVYMLFFEDEIQKQYKNKLNIIHVAHPLNKNFNGSLYTGKPNVYRFKYYLDQRQLKEIQ